MSIKAKGKEITYKSKALEDVILTTIGNLSKIVGVTLGPGGNTVIIDRPGMTPLATKDGVTVADSVIFDDATQYVIAEAAKEACQKTNREAGDGTTTAIVLAEAIVAEGYSYLRNLKEDDTLSPQQLCRELDVVADEVVRLVEESAVPVKTEEELMKVAMISSNADQEVSSCVVSAVQEVGENGSIITEEGESRITKMELKEGFPIGKGLFFLRAIASFFLTDRAMEECVFDYPNIILYDGDLTDPTELLIINELQQQDKEESGSVNPYLIIAHKFSTEVLLALVTNITHKRIKACPLQTSATGQPDSRHALLQDLAVYTGAKVFNGVNVPLSSAKLSDLGQCEKSIVSKHRSVLLGPKDTEDNPAQERIQKRLEELETQMKAVDRDYDGEIIRERIGNLIGGIATIYVGGDSDLEMKERRDRVEDTINAVRSAVEKGVVTGGGAALLGIANHIRNSSLGTRRARTIIAASLEVPFNRILTNVGVHQTEIDALAKSILIDTKTVPNTTFDCLKMEMVQGMEGGIIDPAKVVVSVIKNAMSIAKMLLTLGGAVVIGRDKILERDAEMQALQTAKAMAEME